MSGTPSPLRAAAPGPHPEVEVDDRWLSDFAGDLGRISLSTDDEARSHQYDELGCMGDAQQDATRPIREPRPRHRELGI